MDFIPLIPFYSIDLKRNRHTMFYIIKMIRLIKGFTIFDVPTMMEKVKYYFNEKLSKIIDENPELANDKD
jgi:hypothetical protein